MTTDDRLLRKAKQYPEVVTIPVENPVIWLMNALQDDTPIIESEEVSDGIILDYNAEGKVVGIEVLYISQRSPGSWQQILLETTP